MKSDSNIVSFDAEKGNQFTCDADNIHLAAISLADWLQTSGLIKSSLSTSNTSALIFITPRQDGLCQEQLASIDLVGRIETRISEQTICSLRALIAERSTPDAAKAIDGRIVIITAVSLLAARLAEWSIKTLAGGAS